MTVPDNIKPPKAIEVAAAAASAAAVRKRRRRTPAGGAADDCFTCSKRNVKCDRRRPYCSQCLEVGNECSGYKTQLTWGVGVASRGKLRGLSLPIAKAPPAAGSTSHSGAHNAAISKKMAVSSAARSRAESANASLSAWMDREALAAAAALSSSIQHSPISPRRRFHDDADLYERSPALSHASYTGYEYASIPTSHALSSSGPMSVPMSVPVTIPQSSWGSASHGPLSSYSGSLTSEHLSYGSHPQHPSHASQHMHAAQHHLSASIDSLSDVDYMSPISHSLSREDLPYIPSPTAMIYENLGGNNSPVPQSPIAAMLMEQRPAPTSCPSLVYAPSEQDSSLTSSHSDNLDANLSAKLLRECDSMGTHSDMDAFRTSAPSSRQFWGPFTEGEPASPQQHRTSVVGSWPGTVDDQGPPAGDLVTKMPYLMDYYENTMCPSMVFIDGPNNPYRVHIMQLARSSRSLQHAICALASCNLRMKRKLSLGRAGRDLSDAVDDSASPEDHSVSEEYQHRNLAVHLLNEQLNDPVKSRHDSVLATILLLCHYRMAESGIARFHTHFAGVKKILTLRRSSPYPPSRDCAWMEAIFTYFDAISASINDREGQLNTSFYGVMPDTQLLPPGAENLVGCDRELFRTIIKLGRLNLLSQDRPVQDLLNLGGSGNTSPSNVPATVASGSNRRSPRARGAVGFTEEELLSPTSAPSASALDDHRSTFWREWKEARIALQSWEFDPQRLVASLQGSTPSTSGQVRDLGSLSEAFRYAALLYTERLASPHVPSSHNNFRNLVSQVVYYATSLEAGSSAEKFLLWPLFVAGSECVNEPQQNIIRSKCRDIMARSGYMNNLAALDVLERLWVGDFQEEDEYERRCPFNWARCIGGPGVEVEWIMF
ncbi:gal4-like zn 2cys6 binuclear cluster dna-binding domain-containing protein [Ophiostoma piceae UAMH 11346]|uniref:Gal4-like zn 2cys6 binuclear cluster dna-binding domain-containing protein n=1 Tax=Ophiostoma piceae (strain UAMH 11346) TaxID=1262450 RepID=S3BUV3_OPHP1|nr:gal4-like zn 2cys6 binuclear cluster dna-binding domain-containing protein [Ophiostoma piceae UAMH 11346]